MAFCTLGPIWSRNARLARWGRSTPFPHAYRENRPIFQNKGFPSNPSWIMCRGTLQGRWAPPEHPRDTSHAFSASCCRLPIRPVRDDNTATWKRDRILGNVSSFGVSGPPCQGPCTASCCAAGCQLPRCRLPAADKILSEQLSQRLEQSLWLSDIGCLFDWLWSTSKN